MKALNAMTEDLGFVSRIPMVEEENQFLQVLLLPLHVHCSMHAHNKYL